MMALPHAPHPALTVIDGRLGQSVRRDEARVERIAGLDEAVEGADAAYSIVAALAFDYGDSQRPTDLRWSQALHVIGRIGSRAALARAEILALTPEPAA